MKNRPALTLHDCRKISDAAEAEARRNGWEVAIVILDDGGHLLHALRTDNATPANVGFATEKARTAAISRRPSKFWEERVTGGRLSTLRMPGILPVEGGLPIVWDGVCIGAIGVSGAQSHEDSQVGQAGIATLTD